MEIDITQEIYHEAYEAIKAAMEAATVKGTNPPEPLFQKVLITDAYPLPEEEGQTPEPFKRLQLPMNDPNHLIGAIAFTQTYETSARTSLDDEDGIEVDITFQIDIFAAGGIKKLRNRVFSFFTSVFSCSQGNVTVSWDARTGFDGGPETFLDEYKCRGYIFHLDCQVIKTFESEV